MDKKNWIMAAVTVGALVVAFTVVPALADDAEDATPISPHEDWAEMAELCQSEDVAGHMEYHDEYHDQEHDGDHMDECLAGDGMMDHGMMGGGMMDHGMMGGTKTW